MLESLFQTFLVLIYLDISLVAVTIANYALSASFLGRETRLSRQRMERKEGQLIAELSKLKEKPQIAEIDRKIKETKAEKRRLSIRIFLLSWLGAVILPLAFLSFSLVLAIIGFNSESLVDNPQFLQQQSLIYSIGTTATSFLILLLVIRTIDSAARNIPLPQFRAFFAGGSKKEKVKSKEKKPITFCIMNEGEDIGEDVLLLMNFPPEFSVSVNLPEDYYVFKQGSETDHPGYNAGISNIAKFHARTTEHTDVLLTMPEDEGVYEIPIDIYERKIGRQKEILAIEVTK